jgi:adenylate cyclase
MFLLFGEARVSQRSRMSPQVSSPSRALCLGVGAVVALGLILLAWGLGGVRVVERAIWDAWQARAASVPADARLAVVTVDRVSYADVVMEEDVAEAPVLAHLTNSFPWSRAVWAAVVDRLLGAGAEAVVMDFTFARPGPGDPEWRAALERHGDRVVLGANLSARVSGERRELQWTPLAAHLAEGTGVKQGVVNVRADADTRVRRYRYRHVSGTGLGDAMGAESLALGALNHAGATRVPDEGVLRFTGAGAPGFERRTVADVLVPALWRANCATGAVFRGRTVLIGPTAAEFHDVHPTPAGMLPGVMIHAHAVDTVLRGGVLRETGWMGWALGVLAGAVAGIAPVWRRRAGLPRLAWHAVFTVAWGLGAWAVFRGAGWLAPMVGPLAAMHATGLVLAAVEFRNTRRERARLRGTLERYVSRDVVRAMMDRPDAYLHSLAGQERVVSVLFADVLGFTSMSETAEPTRVVAQLNEFLAEAVAAVFAEEGSLDKFIGDGLMAVWGNVLDRGPDVEAVHAVRAGLGLQRAMNTCNARWAERGWSALRIGVGINTGTAIVGNIGSEQRMELTVIGDTVNLASRLESLTRNYGVALVLGPETARRVASQFVLLPLDRVRVKGRRTPEAVVTVLGGNDALPEESAVWLRSYDEAMQREADGDFAAATAAFERLAAAAWEGEGSATARAGARLHADRCARFQANPPADWDGTWRW